MIVTEFKPYGLIKSQLKKGEKIGIVACCGCARICETGGKEKMDELAERLKNDGFQVVDTDLIGLACDLDQVKKETFGGDVIIVLACDAGVYAVQSLTKGKRIIPALTTTGLGVRDKEGNITLVKKLV